MKFETRIAAILAEHSVPQIIGYYVPILFSIEDAAYEMLTDKAVGAKYEYYLFFALTVGSITHGR